MRNYIKYGIVCMITISLLSSCNVMDTKPFTTFDEELIWNNQEMADAFVMKTYNNTIANFAGGSAKGENLTPNGIHVDQVSNSINTIATETGIDVYTDIGFGRFGDIRKCNMIIEKVTKSEGIPDVQKIPLIAEAFFLRGMLFFDMTRKMGRFVPILKLLTTNDKEAFSTPLTENEAESYKLIIADLDKAIEGLPENSAIGRTNKYAALALRCRIALQAYAYTKDVNYLDITIASAESVIKSNKYSLSANYGNMFNDLSPTDSEIILARYYLDSDYTVGSFPEMIEIAPNLKYDDVINGSANGEHKLNPYLVTFNGWGTFFPTQDLVDQYLSIDEKTGKAMNWYETSQYLENIHILDPSTITTKGQIETFKRFDGEFRHIPTDQDLNTGRQDYPLFNRYGRLKANTGKDVTDIIYANRDKRMDATIVRDKTIWYENNLSMNIGGNASQGVRIKEDGGWYTTTTGYYWRKNTLSKIYPQLDFATKINYHYVITRLGEVYMNLAEAHLLKKNITQAVEALNQTRTTHGELPASTALTEEEAWKDYIRERRVEMAYENSDVYYSYLRWGKYGGYANHGNAAGDIIKDLNAPVYKISITSDRSAFCIGQVTLLNSWRRKFSTKRYLYPIPQGQIDIRTAGGIIDKQNNGW